MLPAQDVALAEPEEDPRKAAIADEVEALLVQRSEARAAKDWGRADAIRDQLNELGVVVTDTTTGPSMGFEVIIPLRLEGAPSVEALEQNCWKRFAFLLRPRPTSSRFGLQQPTHLLHLERRRTVPRA